MVNFPETKAANIVEFPQGNEQKTDKKINASGLWFFKY